MTETKFFEVRDTGTHLPAMCTRVWHEADDADYQMRRAGWQGYFNVFFLTNLITMESNHDIYNWNNKRTMPTAHAAITRDWDQLNSGDVIDVEFELGEAKTKKTSEGNM